MNKNKFIIEDWAGNILDFKRKFKRPQLAVPKEFKSFDSAEDFLCKVLGDDYEAYRDEYYIMEKEI